MAFDSIGNGWLVERQPDMFAIHRSNLWLVVTYYLLEVSHTTGARGRFIMSPLYPWHGKETNKIYHEKS